MPKDRACWCRYFILFRNTIIKHQCVLEAHNLIIISNAFMPYILTIIRDSVSNSEIFMLMIRLTYTNDRNTEHCSTSIPNKTTSPSAIIRSATKDIT